jgi:hypothetical protein
MASFFKKIFTSKTETETQQKARIIKELTNLSMNSKIINQLVENVATTDIGVVRKYKGTLNLSNTMDAVIAKIKYCETHIKSTNEEKQQTVNGYINEMKTFIDIIGIKDIRKLCTKINTKMNNYIIIPDEISEIDEIADLSSSTSISSIQNFFDGMMAVLNDVRFLNLNLKSMKLINKNSVTMQTMLNYIIFSALSTKKSEIFNFKQISEVYTMSEKNVLPSSVESNSSAKAASVVNNSDSQLVLKANGPKGSIYVSSTKNYNTTTTRRPEVPKFVKTNLLQLVRPFTKGDEVYNKSYTKFGEIYSVSNEGNSILVLWENTKNPVKVNAGNLEFKD